MRCFNEQGQPINGAEAFFTCPEGSDIYEPTAQWEARWVAVAEKAPNFDGNLITESLIKNWSVDETVAQAAEDDAEAAEEARAYRDDFEFQLDHDMSMNY
jgi:hypothetical protein